MISSLHHARARKRRAGQPVAPYAAPPPDEATVLRAENAALRARVAELEEQLLERETAPATERRPRR